MSELILIAIPIAIAAWLFMGGITLDLIRAINKNCGIIMSDEPVSTMLFWPIPFSLIVLGFCFVNTVAFLGRIKNWAEDFFTKKIKESRK